MNLSRFLLLITPLLFSVLAITSSCDKKVIELTPTPANDIPENSFYAIVGPNEFVDTVLWAEDDGSVLTITATENEENGYPRMILKFPTDINEGTYELGGPQSENQGLIEFGPLPDQKFEAIDTTGVLVITTHFKESNLMRGKFIFTAKASSGNQSIPNIDVWTGSFLVTY